MYLRVRLTSLGCSTGDQIVRLWCMYLRGRLTSLRGSTGDQIVRLWRMYLTGRLKSLGGSTGDQIVSLRHSLKVRLKVCLDQFLMSTFIRSPAAIITLFLHHCRAMPAICHVRSWSINVLDMFIVVQSTPSFCQTKSCSNQGWVWQKIPEPLTLDKVALE